MTKECRKEFCLEQLTMKVELMVRFAKERKVECASLVYNQADGMIDALFFADVITYEEYDNLSDALLIWWEMPGSWSGKLFK